LWSYCCNVSLNVDVIVVGVKMHFRFTRRTSAIRYFSLSRQMSRPSRGVLNFCNTHHRNEPVHCFGKLSVSSDSTLKGVNHNPNRLRDHLRSELERLIAKIFLIVAFIFGVCSCVICREIRILSSLSVFLTHEDLICSMYAICKGNTHLQILLYSRNSSKHVKQQKGNVILLGILICSLVRP